MRTATLVLALLAAAAAQSAASPRLRFEAASVKPASAGEPAKANVPLGPGDVFTPTGGLFAGTNLTLLEYISFAYKLSTTQNLALRAQLPDWALSQRYDIEARGASDASKDQLRAMLQTLLQERFQLALHLEAKPTPVFALKTVQPGKTGPHLRPHVEDPPCTTTPAGPGAPEMAGEFPLTCGGYRTLIASEPSERKLGARNITMGQLAGQLAGWGELGRPVVDASELAGSYDFTLEWQPELTVEAAPGGDIVTGLAGPTFLDALRAQLGLKLEPRNDAVEMYILDHIAPPSAN